MADEKKEKPTGRQHKPTKNIVKYAPLPRNKATENAMLDIFEYGTERELTNYLRANGLNDDSLRFAEIVKLFHDRGARRF